MRLLIRQSRGTSDGDARIHGAGHFASLLSHLAWRLQLFKPADKSIIHAFALCGLGLNALQD